MNNYTEPQPWVEKPSQWTEDVRHIVRPVVTVMMVTALIILEGYQVMWKGTHINEWFWYLTAVVLIFWFGDRFLKHLIEKRPEPYPPASPWYGRTAPLPPAPPTPPGTPEPALEEAPAATISEKPYQATLPLETEPEKAPRRKSYWEMTPAEAEVTHLGYFEKKIVEAQKTYDVVTAGGYPEDVIKDQKAILDAQLHSLVVARDMVRVVKEGTAQPNALGFIGYRIANVPEDQLPDAVKIWLKNNP